MISRRDKLLVRPWEQRRYEYHRRKVQSALPAIDSRPPANRLHVVSKLKKQQKESERCDKIEKDNFKLLLRMRSLMSTSRVDNTWTTAQPNFLNRVSLYNTRHSATSIYQMKDTPSPIDNRTRKDRCSACTPKRLPPPKIPEERIPWAPPKPQVSRKRSQSLPSRKVQVVEAPKRESSRKSTVKSPETQVSRRQRSSSSGRSRGPCSTPPVAQSLVLTRGDLHLAVSFPPDTLVKLKDGRREKFIIPGPCRCTAIRS